MVVQSGLQTWCVGEKGRGGNGYIYTVNIDKKTIDIEKLKSLEPIYFYSFLIQTE